MKPARFEYEAPVDLDEVLDLLDEHGDEAKVLAGGQSLGPLMNLRLASPALLVDLNHVRGLDGLSATTEHVAVGAITRQRTVERDAAVARHAPVVVEALHSVGHLGIRNRGTVAGSIAHADPAAEMPAVLTLLRGQVRAARRGGTDRLVPAASLFQTYFTTSLEPQEVVTEVLLPSAPPRTGQAWTEFAQRHGDYAIVGVGAMVTLDDAGQCLEARLVCTGVDSVPHDASEPASALVGTRVTPSECADVAGVVAQRSNPGTDAFADAAYRRRLIRALVPEALERARARAANGAPHGE